MKKRIRKAGRPASDAPVRKLTVNLIHTYKKINKVYYAQKEKRIKQGQSTTKSGSRRNQCDDENYNYIIRENEILDSRYIVECRIGKGSFGQVIRALDRREKKLVAIKIIKSRSAFTKQAQTEISVLKFLNSKDPDDRFFIVQLLDTFVHKNHTCLVFEHLSYNLYDLLRNTSFHGVSLNLVRKFAIQILQSLRFLSAPQINVIHCDLKPENILLRHPRRSGIKVIDFGSSCYGDKRMYKYIQSRFYRSPEVVLGLKYDVAIDVWSLGCVLVEMHTGEPVFNGSDEADQLRRIMEILGPIPNDMLESSPKIAKLEKQNAKLATYLKQQRSGTFKALKSLEDIVGMRTGGPGGRRKGEAGHDVKAYEVFVDLIRKLLRYDPRKSGRLTALAALHHPFFVSIIPKRSSSPSTNTSTGAESTTDKMDLSATSEQQDSNNNEGDDSMELVVSDNEDSDKGGSSESKILGTKESSSPTPTKASLSTSTNTKESKEISSGDKTTTVSSDVAQKKKTDVVGDDEEDEDDDGV